MKKGTTKDQEVESKEDKQPEQKAAKKPAYVVVAPFRDANNYSKQYSVGEDVSHLTGPRLEDLIGKGLVEQQKAQKDS